MFVQKLRTKKQPPGTVIRIIPQQQPSKPRGPNNLEDAKPDSFFEAFGPIGVLLFVAAGVSVCWTLWLIVLTVRPNETANYLMDTGDFDNGRFWLIIDPEPELTTSNAVVLAALAVSYVHVLLKMTVMRNSGFRVAPVGPRKEEVAPTFATRLPHIGPFLDQAAAFWIELTGYYGHYRKFWNMFFKVGGLIVEAVQLQHLLEAGFSTSLAYGYAALVACSCLSQAFFILYPVAQTAFTEVLIDTVFDMFFAVVFPIILVVHSYATFDLDRALARLYLEVYAPGSFQRQARMQSDPVETTLFRFAFDSLRTLTWSSLVIRLAMNTSFSYRLSRLVEVVHQRRKNLRTTSSRLTKLRTQRRVPHWMGALFVGASTFMLVYTNTCISESQKACEAYPECVAFAYRWDRQEMCPCLALVDVDRAPKTYAEWTNPVDVTDTVRALAMSGDLQVLQLTNRQMAQWPKELQRCTNLQYLSLYYTGVEVVPDWFSAFHKLEFLDLQGKFGETNIVKMPSDSFSDMKSLTFMHLGYHQLLPQLPSFHGLHNMKSMSIALLYSLTALPDLEPLVKLQGLELVALNSLRTLPGVASNHHLTHLVVWQAQFCCNGFLGDCDVSHPICARMPATDCIPLADQASSESQTIFASQPAICDKNAPVIPPAIPPLKSQIDECGGVLYRQCRDTLFDSRPVGICVSSYFQVIACTSQSVVAVYARRQEIQHGLGLPCDPKEEAWLGCV
ncbi:10 kda heat shock protein [Phytophthora pseudosyringae]|uniref:10 kDa heat shock protein n=1 Tax=Phytophthora pseudosyringae TaxID=221518 RepID=A0A8T1VDM3_9STRA|nr:10 kda heat shock protein [Phytophthora pseudosyringae]